MSDRLSLPLRAEEANLSGFVPITGANGDRICMVLPFPCGGSEKRAKEIVLAVNAHAQLVEACRAMLNSSDYENDERPLMQNIRAALAAAEGKP